MDKNDKCPRCRSRVVRTPTYWYPGTQYDCDSTRDYSTFRQAHNCLLRQREMLMRALDKINRIRNDIIGRQTVNWSAHIYPLVAALNEAGFEGLDHAEAKESAQESQHGN